MRDQLGIKPLYYWHGAEKTCVSSLIGTILDTVGESPDLNYEAMSEYVRYYHEDRTHLGLAKDTPAGRPRAIRSAVESKIRSFPRLGGLHHRYALALAA